MKKLFAALLLVLLPSLGLAQIPDKGIIQYYPPASGGGASVGGNNAWTGTNSFIDANFSLLYNGDLTRIAKFDLNFIGAGTTRTYSLPNNSGILFSGGGSNTQTTGTLALNDLANLRIGSTSGQTGMISYRTEQTPDAPMLLTGTISNSWIFAEQADQSFDFAHALQTNPTLFIHSANQVTNQWISVSHDATRGKIDASSDLALYSGGTFHLGLNGNHIAVPSSLVFGFGSSSTPASADAFWMRDGAAAAIQMGGDVNGAPTHQTYKAHDGITGSNIAGANLTLAGGRGTGTGSGGNLIQQTSPAVASGTTAQTLETRSLIVAKQLTLTDNTIATFDVVTLGNDTFGGGTIHYCVYAADATTAGAECGSIDFAGVDVTAGAGGEVCSNPTKVGTPLQALSGSTLAVTFAATTGTDLCNLRVTADTNIATPVNLYMKWSLAQGNGAVHTPQ